MAVKKVNLDDNLESQSEELSEMKLGSSEKERFSEIDLGDHLKDVREELSKIPFNKPGIYVLDLQAGVGKTTTIKKRLKPEKSFMVVTSSHKLLGEEYEKMGAKHWEGFGPKTCQKYSKVKSLKDANVSIALICKIQGCDKKKCKYWKQFNTQKAVAPYHYLLTNRVQYKTGKKKGNFKFGILVVDESIQTFNTISYDHDNVTGAIETIYQYQPNQEEKEELLNELEYGNFESFNDYIKKKSKAINSKKLQALRKAIDEKNIVDIQSITHLNLYEIKKFFYYENIHGKPEYSEPLFYHIIDIARQGTPVVLLDATFDQKALDIILSRYEEESSQISRDLLIDKDLDPLEDQKINIYKSHIQNKELKIHRMDKNNNYYKTGLIPYSKNNPNNNTSKKGQETIKSLRKYIKKIKRHHQSIGIITYKDIVKHFEDLGKTDYFGNLRGSNEMEDLEVLIIIGTSIINKTDTLKAYNNLQMTNYKEEDVGRLTYATDNGKHYLKDTTTNQIGPIEQQEKKPKPFFHKQLNNEINLQTTFKYTVYLDRIPDINESFYDISNFDSNHMENEKYQAIHRARPLINNEVKIYSFGDVPEKIKEEFTVESYTKEETRKHFNQKYSGVYPLRLYDAIKNYYTKKSKKSTEIAIHFGIYKQKKYKQDKIEYNGPFITTLIKNLTIQKITQIEESIKNGCKTPGEIKKKHRGLEDVDDWFISDCIYYCDKGHFIKNI